MGLFDKIRGTDDEVEIQPRNQQSYDFRDDTEEADDADDEFILPGMKSAGSTDDTPSSDASGRGRSRDDGIDRLIEQNERIIELLEELTGSDDDSTADVGSVL
ncbi:MAG: hypothetical protein ABEI97_05030 [Candidatus Nanohaloarchaea archaeon]